MNGLKLDFSMQRGHEMILEHDPPLMRSGLDQLELNMLNTVKVPQLLPIDWVEQDGHISFHYSLQDVKMLSHFYQQNSITMENYYCLLLSLTDALSSCSEYMLRAGCCLLSEQYIFIDPAASTVRLAYLPVVEHVQLNALKEGGLLYLAVRWSTYVNEVDHTGFQHILHLLSTHKFPLTELRELLLNYIGKGNVELQSTVNQQQMYAENEELSRNKQNNTSESLSFMERKRINFAYPQSPPLIDEAESLELRATTRDKTNDNHTNFNNTNMNWNDMKDDFESDIQRKFPLKLVLISAITILAIIITWTKLYVSNSSHNSLYLCIGITLVLLAILGLIVGKQWRELLFESDLSKEEPFELHTQPSIVSLSPAPSPSQSVEDKTSSTILQPPLATTLISPEIATTYIGQNSSQGRIQLIRSWENVDEIISLEQSPFFIGRSDSGVHYQETASGISRVHIECDVSDTKLKIKDLGSKNGSYLNGTLMIAYKAYPLLAGDTLQLSSSNGPQYRIKLT